MESHLDSVTKTRNPVILILYQLLCWAPQGIKARLELHFSRWNKKEDVPLITPVQETSSNNEAQDQAKTPVQETSSFYVIPLAVKGGQDDLGDDIAVKENIKLMKSPDISSTAQEKGSSLEKSPPISTPNDSGHQQLVEPEDMDQSSPGKVPRKAKRRRRRSRKRRAEATEMEVAEMPSLHLRDNRWVMLLLQISSKLIRCGVGWQIPAAVIWFLLISNALATPLMNKEQLDKQTARKTDFTQASPQCSTCQIHSLCSRGESLTNQLLFIRIAAKDKYCHFQVRSLPYTERCTDVSNVTLINATCLHLNTRDLDYKEFNLEYGTKSKGESAQSVPAAEVPKS
ncbi:uncharacterized protein LOC108697895 isoform X2 [Xenopus laevis]|uniref:Uncharacterized protein LOC108697895 isoform X2 n=1 Tax=Xenopus laevis TaxID=8355 RepID=A0A8J1LF64_XENLA|nr:uncharacterized protein LOC108697895 isoform X2 [Xenopus laevis]